MIRLLIAVCFMALFCKGQVYAFISEDVLNECRSTNNEALDNDFLLGEWFKVINFLLMGSYMPSPSCENEVFTKATAADLTNYGNKHGVTLSMEDNPLLGDRFNGYEINLFTGNTQAKEFYSDWTWGAVTRSVYNVKKLSENFILQWNCALRGNNIWLLSRTPQPTDEEIEAALASVPDVARMYRTKYCVY